MRSFSGLTNGSSSPALSRSMSFDPSGNDHSVLKRGYVKYRDQSVVGWWKSKYAILRPTQLELQKTEQGKTSLIVPLKDVTGVSRFDDYPLCIEIVRAANPSAYPGVPLREQPLKTMYLQFKEDGELYEWQDGIYTHCPAISGVSNPTNFSHRVHVGFDPTNGNFIGLPTEWSKLLNSSAITREDYQKNPQAVIEVLEFYSDITKRAENQDDYSSLMPTPPIQVNQNKQLGHGSGGSGIAPPRPMAPAAMERQASYQNQQQPRYMENTPPRSQAGTPMQTQRKPSGPEKLVDQASGLPIRQQEASSQAKLAMGGDMRRAMEEEAQRVKAQQEQRDRQRREDAEQSLREQEAYNAAIPKKVTPMAQQELGGYGGSSDTAPRYNPSRAAPAAPGVDRSRQQPPGSLRQMPTQRPSPQPSTSQGGSSSAVPRAPYAQSSRDHSPGTQSSLRTPPRNDQQQRQPSPSARRPGGSERHQSPQARAPQTNGTTAPSRLPGPVQQVKPLNVSSKAPNGTSANGQQSRAHVPDGVKQAESALTSKAPAAETRQKEVRMSSMSESEVMSKLKKIVTRHDPVESYVKQRKIGQGASGSVYIAKVLADATSPVARSVYKKDGGEARVAIKTMDLRNQPRKELIVNEIIVMKESVHPNIVNYLDSFLIENDTELWVIMEYMNGGALTDVIENNQSISEDQIAAICREVRIKRSCLQYSSCLPYCDRLAKA